jgi:hypothetical protein
MGHYRYCRISFRFWSPTRYRPAPPQSNYGIDLEIAQSADSEQRGKHASWTVISKLADLSTGNPIAVVIEVFREDG